MAQLWLANYYRNSTNKSERILSLERHEKAAVQGNPKAQFQLGYFHHYGDENLGVTTDQNKALLWLRKAAFNRDIDAYCTLALSEFNPLVT